MMFTSSQAFEYGYTNNGYKYVKHKHHESSYQHAWCSKHCGIEEYENPDYTRVDCLTKTHAVEFDFANNGLKVSDRLNTMLFKPEDEGKLF